MPPTKPPRAPKPRTISPRTISPRTISPRTISRQAFRRDPDRYILAAEREGPISVLDAQGRTRVILSSPLATDEGNAVVDTLLSTHTKGLAVRKPLTRRMK